LHGLSSGVSFAVARTLARRRAGVKEIFVRRARRRRRPDQAAAAAQAEMSWSTEVERWPPEATSSLKS
jgi:NAD(P)-dependent dehydrogenase (short-subunit alcohol dehydrogenase family)